MRKTRLRILIVILALIVSSGFYFNSNSIVNAANKNKKIKSITRKITTKKKHKTKVTSPKKTAKTRTKRLSRGGLSSITVRASAYALDSKTSIGTKPKRNPNGYSTIAVDPNVIPIGTKVYVEGYGYAVAEDIGSSIKGNRIDVYLTTKKDCMNWGVRTVIVHLVE